MQDHADRTITAILGPTNTGKTHYAIERMLSRETGVIGLPLRLLAREIYDRIVKLRGPNAVSLITGEERIAPPRAKYHVSTVEAMPLHVMADFVAIDEIQLCADPDRGHIFTDRLLHARGRYETLFLGSDVVKARIANLVPKCRFDSRIRYSTLSWAGPKKLSRLKPRTAVVAFSVDQVYAIAELIRRQRGGAAVVMGALSPRTRNAQVDLYQNGEVDYMVATDAIGMGLNMDVDHVAFAGTAKFDGWRHRPLMPNELAQIAGRAGRYTKDGSFGTTGEASPLEPEVIDAIEQHRFKPLSKLMYRSTDLNFHSVGALLASLEMPADHEDLQRAREAEDVTALRALWLDNDIQDMTTTGDRVRLLWDVCQIPDFRKVSPMEHASLLSRIYHFLLSREGCIPSDWLAGQIKRLDRAEGDIDVLSKRLAFIRTWTYAANRTGWVADADQWRAETRAVEDRLSDALHARLTQRFVDRRTSHLMRRWKQKERLVAEVNDKGEVHAEGHFLGRLDGFRFTVDESASGDELKTLRSASLSALQAEFARRADKLYLSPDTEIDVTEQGGLMWGTDAVGRVTRGDKPLEPGVSVFVDEMAAPEVAEKVERRLKHWLGRKIAALFEPMIGMQTDEAITGLARGVAFNIGESYGVVPRAQIANDVKQLAQEDRALLRKHGVRFGQHFIFMPLLLKPAPTRMRLLLWSLAQDLPDFPESPPPGLVTVPVNQDLPQGYYEMAGYRPAGARALRIDMMERLADMLRNQDVRGGFEATQDMLSITGLTLEQFAELLDGLGYQGERGERPKAVRPKPEAKVESQVSAEAKVSADAPVEAEAESAPDAAADIAVDGPADQSIVEVASNEATMVSAEASDASLSSEKDTASEQETAPVAEAAAVADDNPQLVTEPTDGVESESSEIVAEAAPDGALEPAEIETFFTFKLKPRNRPTGPRRGQRQAQGDAGQQERDGEGKGARGKPRPGDGEGFKGKGGPKGKSGPRGKGGPKGKGGGKDGGPRRMEARPPRQEKPMDPDSPFAILQKLKDG
ncbi:MAG: helicase-related protein [Paracoccaceae bacterium]